MTPTEELASLRAQLEQAQQNADIARNAGNALYLSIVNRMEPYFSPISRDLEWDVLPSTIGAQCSQLATLRAENVALRELLRVAKCPDERCDNNGTTWDVQHTYEGEPEQVPLQCQWCAERAAHLAQSDAPGAGKEGA